MGPIQLTISQNCSIIHTSNDSLQHPQCFDILYYWTNKTRQIHNFTVFSSRRSRYQVCSFTGQLYVLKSISVCNLEQRKYQLCWVGAKSRHYANILIPIRIRLQGDKARLVCSIVKCAIAFNVYFFLGLFGKLETAIVSPYPSLCLSIQLSDPQYFRFLFFFLWRPLIFLRVGIRINTCKL